MILTKEMAEKVYDRCEEIGFFKMKCLNRSGEVNWADLKDEMIELMTGMDIDKLSDQIKEVVLMDDEKFNSKRWKIKAKLKIFDINSRPNSIGLGYLKLF